MAIPTTRWQSRVHQACQVVLRFRVRRVKVEVLQVRFSEHHPRNSELLNVLLQTLLLSPSVVLKYQGH